MQCPFISKVPEVRHETKMRALAMLDQKALRGCETETKEWLGETREKRVDEGSLFCQVSGQTWIEVGFVNHQTGPGLQAPQAYGSVLGA